MEEVVGAAEIVQLQLGAEQARERRLAWWDVSELCCRQVRLLEEPASKDLGSGRRSERQPKPCRLGSFGQLSGPLAGAAKPIQQRDALCRNHLTCSVLPLTHQGLGTRELQVYGLGQELELHDHIGRGTDIRLKRTWQ